MRPCKHNLEKPIGWQLSRGGIILTLQPRRQTLHSGFYLSRIQRPVDEHVEATFLDMLLETPWHEPEHTSPEKAICFVS